MNRRSIRYRQRVWQSWNVTAIAMAAALWMLAAPAHASTQEYVVLAIGVDNSSENASKIALDYARKRAVYLAVRKMGVSNPGDVAARIPEAEYAQIIRGTTVSQLKRQGNRTFAEVKVSVVDEALRKAIGVKDAPPLTAPAAGDPASRRSVLLLPLLVMPNHSYIWESDNLLRQALSEELLRQSRGEVILPAGDLQDLRLIDRENARTVKAEELKPMFERYGADEIIILIVVPGADLSGEPTQVTLRRLNPTHVLRDEKMEVTPEKPQDLAVARINASARAIVSAAMEIATSTAESERLKLEKAQKVALRFDYSVPKQLGVMEEAVRHAPGVMQLEIPAVTLGSIAATLYYEGDPQALRNYLAKQGVVVKEGKQGWILSTK